MNIFKLDLEDGRPAIALTLTPIDAGRLVTYLAECDIAKKRASDLEKSLSESLEQLEGWVSWKCPKKYREEHEAFIARQRAVLGTPKEPM